MLCESLDMLLFKQILLVACFLVIFVASDDLGFTYHGFQRANLSLDGIAVVRPDGLLQLTNNTRLEKGHAFYPSPIKFKDSSDGSAFSFSTSFVFAIVSQNSIYSGHGIAFVIAPTRGLPGAATTQYIGLFNESNNGNSSNHVFAVELDTIQSQEYGDINDNHVGIDINGLRSIVAKPAGYYANPNGPLYNTTLSSGQPMQLWVEYNGITKQVDVTLAPLGTAKPGTPLLSLSYDLSTVLKEIMYVGFSSATGSVLVTAHYILGWSFKMNGISERLDLSQLPKLPLVRPKKISRLLAIGLPLICIFSLLIAIACVACYVRKRKFAEVLEEWELAYGPHRFKYRDLYIATKGFRDKQLLGAGGFGKVYGGVLPTAKTEVAVKKVSHESRQGVREFIAEIVSIGRLRHRNIVPLLGYCRRKGELLLVYEFMSNGSLDKFLHDQPDFTLNWDQRFKVIKGVASGLLYLHEEWEQVVIHRDVKASNVLLDGELNGRLGDFGLSRLYDHGAAPHTTHVVGTLGYLAPEHNRTGKATTSTDVYAFGAFLLEVACGRRPIDTRAPIENMILVDWVFSCWKKGEIIRAIDQNLAGDYVIQEAELVLQLGLLCSHSEPAARPSMKQVVLYLEGSAALPDLPSLGISATGLTFARGSGVDDFPTSNSSYMDNAFATETSLISNSVLSDGR